MVFVLGLLGSSLVCGQTSGYSYSRPITITYTPNTIQNNFPVLVRLNDPTYKTVNYGGHIQNGNAYDVLFTSDAAGNTPLSYERESYNGAVGELIAWVKLPALSSNTMFYLWYGKASVSTDPSNPAVVWDSHYKAVYHLASPSTSVTDSTANSNTATNTNATAVPGKIGGGAGYNGTSAYIATPTLPALATYTVSAWINPTDAAFYRVVWAANGCRLLAIGNSNPPYVYPAYSPYTPGVNGWGHLVATFENGTHRYYINGASVSAGACEALPSTTFFLGTLGSGQYFQGTIDEARISDVVRSPDWILAEYNNQATPSSFYSVGSETVTGGGGGGSGQWSGSGNIYYNGGNVGIGTTNPQYKLAVDGAIGARDVTVTNAPWSDYVFRPGYRLLPLSEVRAFIQEHRHLPDIPTEAEVKAKGVSVADMQAKLLAKVEELTLHLIQQDQDNRELRARLAKLENLAASSREPAVR